MAPFSLPGSLIVFSMTSLISAAVIQPGRWLQAPLVPCLQRHCHFASVCPLLETSRSHLVSCKSVGRGVAASSQTPVCFHPSCLAKAAYLEAHGLPMGPSAGDEWEQQPCSGEGLSCCYYWSRSGCAPHSLGYPSSVTGIGSLQPL